MGYWIDTHSHLSDEGFQNDPEGYLSRAKDNNVRHIIAISCNRSDWEWNLRLADQNPDIDVAAGFYPGDVQDFTEEDWEELHEILKDGRILAVGEIGLDYYWDKTYTELQKASFIRQIEWANELDKPVLIHCRDAYEDTYEILKAHPVKRGVLFHCYSGSKEMAVQFMTLPFEVNFAFGGTLTYKNNVRAKETVKYLPLERIMLETDSPYLSPQKFRGQKNESKNVRYVGEYMAELKGIAEEELQDACRKNFERFFKKELK
jgi:TatD DNase family protein